jgi:hypothetical protein
MLYRDYDAGEIEAAVELATENNISTSAGVRHLLVYIGDEGVTSVPLAAWSRLPAPDVAAYGQLGGVR